MTCEDIVKDYLNTLEAQFACLPASKGRLRVVTPYLYPDHDQIELFIRESSDGVVVSDLGETLRHLDTLGMDVLANQTRLFQTEHIVEGLGVELRQGVLLKKGSKEAVGTLMFDVLAACKAVADLVYGTRAYEPATFQDEVAEYLRANKFQIEKNVPIVGQISGTRYTVDLRVPAGERVALIATISPTTSASGTRRHINQVFRMWSDVNGQAWKHSLLNNIGFEFKTEDLRLIQRVSSIHLWSEREQLLSALRPQQLTPSSSTSRA